MNDVPTFLDLIVGGPPCQGFSTARQVDGANHGERLKEDPRRHLYKEFLRHVEHFQSQRFDYLRGSAMPEAAQESVLN